MRLQDLAAVRKQHGWTQKQAATRLGVSQPYLSMLESGQRPVPARLARRLARVLGLPPTALPLGALPQGLTHTGAQELARDLGALGYPGLAYLAAWRRKRNPAQVLLTALMQPNLEARLVEALPWLVLRYWNMDHAWMVSQAKLHDLQNRLGFVVSLARTVAARLEPANPVRDQALAELEARLAESRLAREDTLCQNSVTEAERRWLVENSSEETRFWNLLTAWRSEHLRYVQ